MNQNSGGWRYGNGGSNQFLYRNEEVDNELLKRAAGVTAPKGLLDTKIEASPLDKYLQQDSGSGGNGNYGGNPADPSTHPDEAAADKAGRTAALGTLGWGDLPGVMSMNPLGLGKTALDAATAYSRANQAALDAAMHDRTVVSENSLRASSLARAAEARAAHANIDATNPAGYGWSSLSPDVQASIAVADDPIGAFANSIGMGDTGGWSPSYGDTSTADSPGGSDMGGYGGADNGYYKGGMVKGGLLAGPNPKGPDDGYAALDHGEYVIRASAVKKYGKGLLDAINTEKFKG